jgi:hypothetical protein
MIWKTLHRTLKIEHREYLPLQEVDSGTLDGLAIHTRSISGTHRVLYGDNVGS